MWWPRSLRRPSDLWTRLPWQARLSRSVLSGFFVAIPVMIAVRHWLGITGWLPTGDPAHEWFLAAEAIVVAVAAAVTTGAVIWARSQKLTFGEGFRVLFGATTPSPSWDNPRITRLLAPATGRVRPPHPDDPADHERAIAEVVPLLPATAGDTGVAAAATGARLLRAIEQQDQELLSLERVASASEADRLWAQLASLGDEAAGESSERRELRELLRHQLEVVHRVRGRRETVAQQRAHYFDLLRGLWTQLRGICDLPSDDERKVTESSERLRSLCSEIAAALETSGGSAAEPALASIALKRPRSISRG